MTFFFLILIQLLYQTAIQGTRPIVSLFADINGATSIIVGLLFSVYAFFPMLLALRAGKWLDRYGSRRLVAGGGLGIFLGLLIPVLFPNILALFFSQIVIGLSQIFVQVSIQKTVGNLPGNRDKLIANLTFIASGGALVGPLLSGFIYDHFGFRITFGFFIGVTVIALSICILLNRHIWSRGSIPGVTLDKKKQSSWSTLRNINLRNALMISGLVLYSKNLFIAYFPVYASDLGLSPSTIGTFLSLNAGMAMFIRLFQFQLVQAFSRRKVLAITLVIGGIAYFLIPFTTPLILLAILCILLGAGLGLGQPLSLVYALNITPSERQGEVLGMRLTFNRGSQFAAPLVYGAIGFISGIPPIFWINGVVLLFGTFLTRSSSRSSTKKI